MVLARAGVARKVLIVCGSSPDFRRRRRRPECRAFQRREAPMTLIRWDPFRELEGIQSRLNRLFHETPARRGEDEALFFTDWAPAVDIQETDKEYVLKADLPEVRKEDVKVEVDDGVLIVEGERKQEKEETGRKFHRMSAPTASSSGGSRCRRKSTPPTSRRSLRTACSTCTFRRRRRPSRRPWKSRSHDAPWARQCRDRRDHYFLRVLGGLCIDPLLRSDGGPT